jgi:hypothetical protein
MLKGRAAARKRTAWRMPELVNAVNKLVLTLLVIPLLIVVAVRNPQGAGHLVEIVFVGGAKLFNLVATIGSNMLGGHAR